MKPVTCILFHAFFSLPVTAKPADSVFNIVDYGAVGDGSHLCTTAIQQAIDACHQAGGGRVLVPQGRFLSGGLVMKSHVGLHLSAGSVLLGSAKHDDYPTFQPACRSHQDINGFHALIYAEKAEGFSITGEGTIDGQGKLQKPRPDRQFKSDRDGRNGRPRNLLFVSCRGIRVEGIMMRNAGIWNQHYLDCDDVIVDRIQVYNHANLNNDGIDIDGCRRFVLSNSILDSDDDGIVIKSTGSAPAEYITIANCIVSSHCNAIKTGTESTGGFRHITISNCVVKPSASGETILGQKNGITGITIGCVDGGVCENINVNNVVIEGTKVPLFIRLGARNRPHVEGAVVKQDSVMRNISISNVTASGSGDWGCAILGMPGNPIRNLRLSNITLELSGGGSTSDREIRIAENPQAYPEPTSWGKLPAYGMYLRHAADVQMDAIILQTAKPDARSAFHFENIERLDVGRVIAGDAKPSQMMVRKNVTGVAE
jgi:polygalacturonase